MDNKNLIKTCFILVNISIVFIVGAYIWLAWNETRMKSKNDNKNNNNNNDENTSSTEAASAEEAATKATTEATTLMKVSSNSLIIVDDLNMNGKSIVNAPNILQISNEIDYLNTSLKAGKHEFENILNDLNRLDAEIKNNRTKIDINMAIIALKVSKPIK
jgi:cytoskeletal protein RodZ